MAFNQVFGGQNIYPAQLTLLRLDMTADVTLQWPVEQAIAGADVFADIIEAESDAARTIILPDATLASPGQATLINNVGAFTIDVEDADGNTVGAVPSGEVWQFYLQDNDDAAGTWRTFEFGTGVSSATAAALAGAGLVAITTTLNVRTLPEEQAVTPYSVVNADRAKTKIWTGGVGTFDLPDPATLGASWMVNIRNSGSGDLTVNTAAGYINTSGITSMTLPVGASALFVVGVAGAYWFTLAESGGTAGDFSFISINVAGGAGDTTLAGAQLNRVSYRFTGALTGARNIIVPNTIQQYWVSNQTSGAFTLTVKTALGIGVVIPQGYAAIVACDGVNVVAWEGDPATAVIPPTMGGTGLNAYVLGDIVYASAANTLARLPTSASATRYLSNTGVGNTPAWAQVNLANGVTGQLPFANMADGSATSVLGRAANSAGVMASIAAAGNDTVLSRVANALVFGQLTAGMFPNAVVPDAALSTNIPLKNGVNVYTNTNSFSALLNYDGSEVGFRGYPFDDDSPHSADYTLDANDHGRCVFFSAAHGAGDTVTIPSNGSGTFASLGITVLVVNDSATDDLEIAIDTDTLYLAGTTTTGPQMLKPKGACLLYRTQSTEWLVIPIGDSINYPASETTVYAGWIDSGGASFQFDPDPGFSVSSSGTGNITVVHNFGLATANDLSVAGLPIGGGGQRNVAAHTLTVNQFQLELVSADAGADFPIFLIMKRNA